MAETAKAKGQNLDRWIATYKAHGAQKRGHYRYKKKGKDLNQWSTAPLKRHVAQE